MTDRPFNVHGTAIVLETKGFLLVGPSGAGKSTVALALMAQARLRGLYAALVSDDQVLISKAGGHIIAHSPQSIHGLLEIRGAGIAKVEAIPSAVLNFALRPIRTDEGERLPPEGELHILNDETSLPLLRLPSGDGRDSFAILEHLLPLNSAFAG